ncbi:MAG: ChaN family lipoprotein [Endomicrobium sp.]|jgi:uncharacterized iron-regulated protein|nr:ChaN family lipoprotein [Endomicrobium sp.]
MIIKHPRNAWIETVNGAELDKTNLLKAMSQKQAVLLGERHDIAEIHRWQLHTANYLHAYRSKMFMGFEMFPVSVQPVLDRWVAGELKTEEFLNLAQWDKVWGFPPEIYLPLFHFCRQNCVPMVALNCYRELVTRVGKEGWDAIPESERDGLTPSATALEAHKKYLSKLMGKEVEERFVRAQQTWDRAFACNIKKALDKFGSDYLAVGIIGKGHLEYGYGTPYQLKDLSINDTAVLLPSAEETLETDEIKNIADAICRIDIVEQPAERRKK